MNVNKKLGRFKQWAGERVGGEAKTNVSDDFKSMEEEMNLRSRGMTKNQQSMSAYVKSLQKRGEGEDKEKVTPVAWLGQTMVNHGEDFENDSEFGQCLIALGHTNERISRFQDTYSAKASSTWLEGLDRSIAQMKEYQASRKKLEQRRLNYDTALTKMQKAKKEDFRSEEELRCQKAKYEESSEDVYRRMQDIQETEQDSVNDLTEFLDSELAYYARCHEALLQLRNNWPAGSSPSNDLHRKNTRSRSNTAHSFRALEEEEAPPPPERPAIRSTRTTSGSLQTSPKRELPGYEWGARPSISRTATMESPSLSRVSSYDMPDPAPRMARVPSDTLSIRNQKAQLRGVAPPPPVDGYDISSGVYGNSIDRSVSPAVSVASSTSSINSRKAPPPPPPSRAKKPPPPPPMKRSALSATSQPAYA